MKQNLIRKFYERKNGKQGLFGVKHSLFRAHVTAGCFLLILLFCGCPVLEPDPTPVPMPTAVPTQEPTSETTQEPTPGTTLEPTAEPTSEPTAEPTAEPTPERVTIELGDITGPDDQRYICYEDSRGNTVSHSFEIPSNVARILSGTIYVRYTNNDPEGYLRACNLLINNEPSHCSPPIGCYRVAQHQVRGFTASRGQTVARTFDIKDVMYPVNHPGTGSVQVDLSQYLVTGTNSLTTWISHGSGAGSLVTVRIVLEVELKPSQYTIELGNITGPDDHRYICYEDSRGNTVSHPFDMPAVNRILSGTIYVRYTNNDPEGYLRACNLLINNEPSHCSPPIGCYRVAQHQVRGFTASRGQTVARTFDIKDVMYPVNHPGTGSVQVDLSQYLVTGTNSLTTWVSHGSGAGSLVTVRIVLEVES